MHTASMSIDKTETIRVTVPVSKEVQEVFKRIADASGSSVGRSMGDWLADTLDAAQTMADLIERARKQPRLVAQELNAYAHGLTDITAEVLESLRRSVPVTPPVGNTGGKLPKTHKTAGRVNAKKRD